MTELVVLADGSTAPKESVHHADTPLHHAFSCWVTCGDQVLLTRRALSKQTWPGVWTNSFCGHPAPGETHADAVVRRAAFELGIGKLESVEMVLPDFAYRAQDSSGIVENELCPVFLARVDTPELAPNPDEVDSFAWVEWDAVRAAVAATPFAFSPWMVLELEQLPHTS